MFKCARQAGVPQQYCVDYMHRFLGHDSSELVPTSDGIETFLMFCSTLDIVS